MEPVRQNFVVGPHCRKKLSRKFVHILNNADPPKVQCRYELKKQRLDNKVHPLVGTKQILEDFQTSVLFIINLC